MDVENLAKELILKNMTPEQQMAVLESVRQSVANAKEVQKKKIGENVDLVVQALKKIEADIRDRFDAVGNSIEKRVSSIKDGRDGANGTDGRDGKDGKSGRDGLKGDRGVDGQAGRDGVDGVDGISVVNAQIDFDGSLVITLSDGRELNVGEVVSADVAEKIKVISTMSTNGAVGIKDEGTSISTGVKTINFVGAAVTATNSGDDVTVNVSSGTGTVTSVGLSGGTTGLTTTGSPITTTGTITLGGTLAVASGGTGTATPSLVAGTNITSITGTWPNQTINASGGAGTVTSVAATVPAFLSVTGSPITTSGTLAIGLSGTALPILNGGTGNLTGTATINANLTGDVTSVGNASTLATVNTNVGSFTNASVTVNGKGLVTAASSGTAPVTSVTATSPVASSGGATPAISLSANYGDTLNPYASKTLKYVLAAPNAADGVPTFRAIVASDIPTLNQSTTGSAATLTTTRAIYGNNFDGSAALTQIIASTYGGTGNGFTKFTGATTAERTYTLPDASSTIVVQGGALGTPSSGTVTNLTGTASININGTVGATTPAAGAFTSITASTTLGVTGAITPSQTAGIVGTTTNNNANAGSIGEVISSSVAVGSAVSITTATTATSGKTVTSISLTAGDWDIFGTIGINLTAGTKFTVIAGGINTVTNELNALYEEQLLINYGAGGLVPLNTQTYQIPTTRVSIASTTTYYLIAYAQFTVNTATGYGRITARRRR